MAEEEDYRRPCGEEVWDEYCWEAHIRRQNDQADQYLALLEYYADENDAHNLIARSMGWDHLLTNCAAEPDPARCTTCPPARRRPCRFYESYFGRRQRLRREAHGPLAWEAADEDPSQKTVHGAQYTQWQLVYAQHPVRSEASAIVNRLSETCTSLPGGYPESTSGLCRLLHHVHCCVGKISAGLNHYVDPAGRGLIIAHLKAAFQAACLALGQISACLAGGELAPAEAEALTRHLLNVRAHLLELIEDFRTQLSRMRRQKGCQ